MYQPARRRSQRRGGRVRIARALVAVLSMGLVGVVVVPSAGTAEPSPALHTVVRGLDNPRGLVVLPNGTVAVAEAGHARPLCLRHGECAGLTARVDAVDARGGLQRTLEAGRTTIR